MKANQIIQQYKRSENVDSFQKSLSRRPSVGTPIQPGRYVGMCFRTNLARMCLVIGMAVICVLSVSFVGITVSAGEQVTFKSADSTVSAPIPATVFRPKGSGPFPGVVLLHSCSGIRTYHSKWAEWLANLGYIAILSDSLSPRNVSTFCDSPTPRSQALDGLGALAYLRNQPDVIPTKIAVMGWSHGGAATLISASARFINATNPAGGGYQAAIAFYPACGAFQDGNLATPLLMLMGSVDDWDPPGRCVERGTALQNAGTPVEWKVYKGAMHCFDDPVPNREVRVSGRTYHLGYDRTAAKDAFDQVQRFLKTYLQ